KAPQKQDDIAALAVLTQNGKRDLSHIWYYRSEKEWDEVLAKYPACTYAKYCLFYRLLRCPRDPDKWSCQAAETVIEGVSKLLKDDPEFQLADEALVHQAKACLYMGKVA